MKHVCNPKTIGASDKGGTKVPSVADFRKYEDAARHGLRLDQKERIDRLTLEEYLKAPPMTPEENAYAANVKFVKFNQENKATLPTIAAEFIGWNNGERLVTGKDPLTGKDANRWAAGAELAFDIASYFYPIAKADKLRKLEKTLDAVDAVNDASKVAKAADKANDASKAAKAVDKVLDTNKVNKPLQMHHYATNKSKKYTAEFERIVQRYNLDLDGMWNKELLPRQGRHPNAYHEFVKDKLNFIDGVANGNQEIFLDLYEKEVKSIIRNNPDMLYSNYWKGLD